MIKKNSLASLFAVAVLSLVAPVSQAQAMVSQFDLPSQPLPEALRALGSQTSTNVLFDPPLVEGRDAPALKAELTLDQAFARLLAGTGLRHRFLDDKTVMVISATAPVSMLTASTQFSIEGQNTQYTESKNSEVSAETSEDQLEEIMVTATGTNIRGVAPVGSALTSVGREEIVDSGATTVFEALQQVPAVSLLGNNESSRGSQGGSDNIYFASSVNLRGLGPQATLTLLDGTRMPPSERFVGYIDPSFLPAAALERVEVLSDGASAIYGSDAVAGVVNFILRRNLNGVEVTGRGGFADGYSERSAEVAAGKVWDSGQFMLALSSNYHTNLAGSDRDYNSSDLRPFGGSDFRSTSCTPGTITIGTTTYAVPNGNPTPGSLVAGTRNLCNNWTRADLIPEQRRSTALITFTQKFSERISLIGDGHIARRKYDGQYEQAGTTLTIPDDHAFFVLPAGVTLADLPNCTSPALAGHKCYTVSYNPTDVYGLRHAQGHVDYYRLRAGLDIQLTDNWQLQVSGNYGLSKIKEWSNTYNSSAITAATTGSGRTSAATAFDPFGGRTSAATTNSVLNWYTNSPGENRLTSFSASANGALFTLPGGTIKSAFGVEHRNEYAVSRTVSGPEGSTPTGVPQNRNIAAAYGEFVVPLIGAGNALPGARSLELALAGRWERYSDVGETSNPKFGVNWSPFNGLKVRGSYSTSFRVPTPKNLAVTNTTLAYLNVSDPQAGGALRSVLFVGGTARNLKPERAKSYSFGVDFTPQTLAGLKLSATWFNVDYTDKIDNVFLNTSILLDQALYSNLVRRTTNSAEYLAYESNGTLVGQSQATTAVAIIDGTSHNLGAVKTNGFDFSLGYLLQAGNIGNFNFMLNGTKLNKYDIQVTASAPAVSKLDIYGNPISLRMRGGVGWQKGGLNAGAFVNHTGGYEYPSGGPVQHVESSQTVDAVVGYKFEREGWLENLKIALNVTNLFDTAPPFVNVAPSQYNAGGYDAQIASAIGREIVLTVIKKW